MSRKKLTLSVDETAIKRARRYSKRHQTSISELVTRFLESLDEPGDPVASPVVDSLRGVLPQDVDRSAYRDHLKKKYEE